MFAALGYHVVALKRERIGALFLDNDLKIGETRPLTESEARKVFEKQSV